MRREVLIVQGLRKHLLDRQTNGFNCWPVLPHPKRSVRLWHIQKGKRCRTLASQSARSVLLLLRTHSGKRLLYL